jgi:GrpB-like predicted nucleotidyltransferase (UPF0157 family)
MTGDRERGEIEARLRAAYPDAEFLDRASLDPVVIVDYSASWQETFEEWRDRLREALGTTARRIEHIGSTAVPGLAAKPVVDVQVSVPDVADEPSYLPQIEALGLPLRVREPDHRYFRAPGERRVVQVHVCRAGGAWERDHLLFRDFLRAHPDTAAAYARLKAELARRFRNDRLGYTEGKSSFILTVLDGARRWARGHAPEGTAG